MSQKDNILQELRELQSSLAKSPVANGYEVPAGYFEGLAEQVMRRIKAMESETAGEEMELLSPMLNSISRQMPNAVPAGFFNELDSKVMGRIKTEQLSATEELAELSPLLSGLKKEMPYSVPANYFEQLDTSKLTVTSKPAAKVVSMPRKQWFRYAAAAVVTGIVVLSGLLIFQPKTIDPNERPTAWVEKKMKKVSTESIDEFNEMTEKDIVASIDPKAEVREADEVKELIKDIPEDEIQKFLDDTQADDADLGITGDDM